jgi:hypothetical protein
MGLEVELGRDGFVQNRHETDGGAAGGVAVDGSEVAGVGTVDGGEDNVVNERRDQSWVVGPARLKHGVLSLFEIRNR